MLLNPGHFDVELLRQIEAAWEDARSVRLDRVRKILAITSVTRPTPA
jgi:hypothetical protein